MRAKSSTYCYCTASNKGAQFHSFVQQTRNTKHYAINQTMTEGNNTKEEPDSDPRQLNALAALIAHQARTSSAGAPSTARTAAAATTTPSPSGSSTLAEAAATPAPQNNAANERTVRAILLRMILQQCLDEVGSDVEDFTDS